MTLGDQKDFASGNWKFSISVLEVTDPAPGLQISDELLLELRILKVEKGDQKDGSHDNAKELDFALLFVVDITKECSTLLVAGGRELALAKAAFPDGTLHAAKPDIIAPGETINHDET